ncbi:hypothetical protein PUN28_008128 [Cardiocondyla obscurior]|uniref:Uncharacterized protein n=1 Tax=Cardiocondyla obscurior TaxID=286306 RepID=A0AAW2FW84_9HYME
MLNAYTAVEIEVVRISRVASSLGSSRILTPAWQTTSFSKSDYISGLYSHLRMYFTRGKKLQTKEIIIYASDC